MFIMPFATARIHAQMRELTVREAVELCQIPDHLNELGIGRALKAVVSESNIPPEQWTVQERCAAIGHYITALENGDWQVADNASYSDYLTGRDYPLDAEYVFADDEGTELEIVPLTGEYAEACERAVNAMDNPARGDWVLAAMAALIRVRGDAWDGTPDAFVQENIKRLRELPESQFAELHGHFQAAWQVFAHGFEMDFDAEGWFVKGGADLPSVRFPFIACVGAITAHLWREFA